MKSNIKITYNSGEQVVFTAQPPEYAKWERETGKTIRSMSEPGLWDVMFLAYHAMKRNAGGKPVKSFEIWMENVADVEVENNDPKAIEKEASIDS